MASYPLLVCINKSFFLKFILSDMLFLPQPFAFAVFVDQQSAIMALHSLNVSKDYFSLYYLFIIGRYLIDNRLSMYASGCEATVCWKE